MPRKSDKPSETITRGSTNVFADLGFADAKERQTKLKLAMAINQVLQQGHHTQAQAAALLGVKQPKISDLKNYKLEGLSVEKLMTYLVALDRDVEISIRKKPASREAARISVVAA